MTDAALSKEDIDRRVEEELAQFESFFCGLGNERLARPERYIVATYIVWKLGVGVKENTGG
jgi:hypothetical protein